MNKKFYLLVILFFSLSSIAHVTAQQFKVVPDNHLAKVLAFIEQTKEFFAGEIAVKLYKVGFPDDTIKSPGTHEISNRIYMVIMQAGR
ncbi:MAG: hypothetical protein JWN76_490 [Chitinophagaceae bacterium]|nr:hypothetical protein [Chitinophagaceae bacterium]